MRLLILLVLFVFCIPEVFAANNNPEQMLDREEFHQICLGQYQQSDGYCRCAAEQVFQASSDGYKNNIQNRLDSERKGLEFSRSKIMSDPSMSDGLLSRICTVEMEMLGIIRSADRKNHAAREAQLKDQLNQMKFPLARGTQDNLHGYCDASLRVQKLEEQLKLSNGRIPKMSVLQMVRSARMKCQGL